MALTPYDQFEGVTDSIARQIARAIEAYVRDESIDAFARAVLEDPNSHASKVELAFEASVLGGIPFEVCYRRIQDDPADLDRVVRAMAPLGTYVEELPVRVAFHLLAN